jgi:hypothetical protein
MTPEKKLTVNVPNMMSEGGKTLRFRRHELGVQMMNTVDRYRHTRGARISTDSLFGACLRPH